MYPLTTSYTRSCSGSGRERRRTWIRNTTASAGNDGRQSRQLGIGTDDIQNRRGVGAVAETEAEAEETAEEREQHAELYNYLTVP